MTADSLIPIGDRVSDAYLAGKLDSEAEYRDRERETLRDLRLAIGALPLVKPAACSCDIGDGDWTRDGYCVGCRHAPHAADDCGASVKVGLLLSEYRTAVLSLLDDQP